METIDSAAPSSLLSLKDSNPALFGMRDKPNVPATASLPGSSSLELVLIDAIATGTVKASVPGTVILTLYGASKADVSADINDWLPLGSSIAEPIGGADELPETMWMIRGRDLMVFSGSGKMQGMFDSNVAGTPQPPVDLEHHPDDITEADPLYVFAVGASFTPTASRAVREVDAELCSLTMRSLVISG